MYYQYHSIFTDPGSDCCWRRQFLISSDSFSETVIRRLWSTSGGHHSDCHCGHHCHPLPHCGSSHLLHCLVSQLKSPFALYIPFIVQHVLNPRRACAMVTVVVVCVCVPALAASASVYTCNQRYSRVSLRLFLDFDSWFFEKNFRSKFMA